MSKKPKKTARSRRLQGRRAKSAKAATKRPAAALERTTPPARIARALEAIAGHLSAASPAAARRESFGSRRRLRLAPGRTAGAGAARQPGRSRPAQGHRPDARHPDREHRALRRRPARQQRAAVGRARHGQVLAGQGGACQHQCRPQAGRPPEADRDPPRGYREPARPDGPAARASASASSCSATTSPSTATTPPTNR